MPSPFRTITFHSWGNFTMKAFATLLTIALLCVGASTASAQNGRTNEKVVEFCEEFYTCCDGWVELCGQLHLLFDRNGNLVHANIHGTATAPSGQNYVAINSQNWINNGGGNGASNGTVTFNTRIVATGNNDCSATISVTFHYTMNPDGTITAEVERIVDNTCWPSVE
jgi:hypothetical protein